MTDESLFPEFEPGFGLEWLENKFVPQTTIFYADLLPVIYRCSVWLGRQPVRICDVGAASGAGGDLVHKVQNHLLGWATEVTCFDEEERFLGYANARFPSVRYRTDDLFATSEEFDLVIASHVIEHVADPEEFVQRLRDRVEHLVIGYVPFEEVDRIPEHLHSFDAKRIGAMPGVIWARSIRTLGWRTAQDSMTAVFVCAAKDDVEKDWSGLRASLDSEFEARDLLDGPGPDHS